MTRALCLLRHAKTEHGFDKRDFDRALTRRGLSQCHIQSVHLAKLDWRPDFVLCSSAVRTRQTLDALDLDLAHDQICYVDGLYEAACSDLYEHIKALPGTAYHVLVIGHNPTIAQMTEFLTSSYTETAQKQAQNLTGFPTGAMAFFDISQENWTDIQPHSATCSAIYVPD